MNILVCIKNVPAPSPTLVIDADRHWITDARLSEHAMNRFDEYALEEAILIKESHPNVGVDVVSVGPERVIPTLKRAIGKGADQAVHIDCPEPGHIDAHVVSLLITEYAASIGYDLILTGVMSEDAMQYMVGPLIAARLGIPCAVSVVNEVLDRDERTVTVMCEMEGGMSEKAVLGLPALLTIQSGINHPRYPSLSNMLRSKSQKIITIRRESHLDGRTNDPVFSISMPEKAANCNMITGSADEKADELFHMLRDNALFK